MRADYTFLQPVRMPPDITPSLRVGVVPTPDFTLMSLACFIEFLRLAADESDFSRQIYCAWDLLSHVHKPVVASCGFAMLPTSLYGDPRQYDYIVIHGGLLHSKARISDELYAFVQDAKAANVPLVGLCTGQFIFAELGFLNGRRCGVHFSLAAALRQNFPDVIGVTDMPVVVDGEFITCPGGLAAVNLAMHLVTTQCGRLRTQKALHYLMAGHGFDEIHEMQRDPEIGLNCLEQRVVNAVGLMRQKIFEKSSVAEIAKGVGTTERELTRLFRKHLNTTPGAYWRLMRIRTARWMILNSSRSVTQIAFECGFNDSSHMIYWFKRAFNMTPAKLRKTCVNIGIH